MHGLDLYVIGYFADGELKHFVRKGRNRSISGYDDLASAKRGLAQSLSRGNPRDYRILKASDLTEVSL